MEETGLNRPTNSSPKELARINPSPKGFVWKITNKDGIDHYLLGSPHAANRRMMRSPVIKSVLGVVHRLFAEDGALNEELLAVKESAYLSLG